MKYLFCITFFFISLPVLSDNCVIYINDARVLVKGEGCVIKQQKPLIIKNTTKNNDLENVQLITIDGINIGDITIIGQDQKESK